MSPTLVLSIITGLVQLAEKMLPLVDEALKAGNAKDAAEIKAQLDKLTILADAAYDKAKMKLLGTTGK